jgi:UDP-glucose-4-epimerase GalE
VLVVGGAGYIGSHVARAISEHGGTPVVLDDFSTGHREAVRRLRVVECALEDTRALDAALAELRPRAILHLAGRIRVEESVLDPARYFASIAGNTLRLLDAACRHGVKHFVYSSSAAVYRAGGNALKESAPIGPANPYGEAKAMVEAMLPHFARAYGLGWVALRYFNAAGAHPDGTIGEWHEPETHLIPLALRAASGRLAKLHLYGTDWSTPDGTCVRDYVHVCDLADGHRRALDYLAGGGESRALNLGSGHGHSVREAIAAVERVTGGKIAVEESPRRAGDQRVLVADASAAREALDWRPRYADLDTIVAHAWRWEQRLAGERQ